ncbi:hypothetical protein KI387_036914, partial [Taxus chinensis]
IGMKKYQPFFGHIGQPTRGSIKNQLKELYPHITRRMDVLEDIGKEIEGMVETINTQGDGIGFEEVNTLVGDLCQKVENEVDA